MTRRQTLYNQNTTPNDESEDAGRMNGLRQTRGWETGEHETGNRCEWAGLIRLRKCMQRDKTQLTTGKILIAFKLMEPHVKESEHLVC